MQALEFGFCLAQIAGIGNSSPVAIGVEGFQPHIDARLFAGRGMLNLPGCLYRKLHIIAISPLHQPDPLDLGEGEGFDAALLADQLQASDTHAEVVV